MTEEGERDRKAWGWVLTTPFHDLVKVIVDLPVFIMRVIASLRLRGPTCSRLGFPISGFCEILLFSR